MFKARTIARNCTDK